MLEAAAIEGRACPTNFEICAAFGWSSTSTPVDTLRRMERQGLIEVRRYHMHRVIMIPRLGKSTAEPDNARPRPKHPKHKRS